jgi:hypothetical protein
LARPFPNKIDAEVLLVLLPDRSFSREADPATGFAELVVRSESHKDN